MDLDLRKLRYFVAVAERLHFGRAADDLHIAQPALSRQIVALEKDLGTALLTRDSHGVELTAAGQQLARREQITEADLEGEPLIWHADASTQPTRRPHPDAGYRARGVDETLEHVAAGRGICS